MTGEPHSVQAALHLAGAGPAPRPRALARLEPPGTRPTPDRAVPVGEQRIHEDAVLGDVALDLVLGPGGDRVELHHGALLVPFDDPNVVARGRLVAAQPGRPCGVVLQGAAQRQNLTQRTALVGVAFVEPRAEGRVLLVHRLPGAERADRHRKRRGDRVAGADRL